MEIVDTPEGTPVKVDDPNPELLEILKENEDTIYQLLMHHYSLTDHKVHLQLQIDLLNVLWSAVNEQTGDMSKVTTLQDDTNEDNE